MLQEGLVEEVKTLKECGCRRDMVSMQGLGYKEILRLPGREYDLDRAVYSDQTRYPAFRQKTADLVRRERDVIWLENPEFDSEEEILSHDAGMHGKTNAFKNKKVCGRIGIHNTKGEKMTKAIHFGFLPDHGNFRKVYALWTEVLY